MITDTIHPCFIKNRNSWILKQANETFYDEERTLREFETAEDALHWARDNLPGWMRELVREDPVPSFYWVDPIDEY